MRAIAGIAVAAAIVCAASSAGAREGESFVLAIDGATHRGIVEGDRITWHSHIVSRGFGPDARAEVRLASPLPEGAQLDEAKSEGARALRDPRGAIRALAFDRPWAGEANVVVTQPLASRAEVSLSPPLVAGDVVQVVSLEGRDDVRFEPDASLGIARHVDYSVGVDVDDASRHHADQLLGVAVGIGHPPPLYLRAHGSVIDRGLAGKITTAKERSRPAFVAIVVAFVAAVGALALAYRKLARDARIEQAESDLKSEFERLGRGIGA